jgi:hypothetical protein
MVFVILLIFIAYFAAYSLRKLVFRRKNKRIPENIMIIFGSGGHTSEILMLFKDYDFKQHKKLYFLYASTDTSSMTKALTYFKQEKVKLLKCFYSRNKGKTKKKFG